MKSTVYWFSGTGNSYYVASKLASSLPDCTLCRIEKHPGFSVIEPSEIVGIVLPVYFGGPPAMIKAFIKEQIPKVSEHIEYLFIVYTHGGLPLYVAPIMERLLASANVGCSYATGIKMVDSYVPLFKIPDTNTQDAVYERADKQIAMIADDIAGQSIKVPTRPILSNLYQRYWDHHIKKYPAGDNRFIVSEACTKCGQCVLRCPAGNITLHEQSIKYHHACEQCFGCYHCCPAHAISFTKKPARGYSWYPNKRSGFQTYSHTGEHRAQL
ncbi:MAG: EFR1 family ferrodoxin [Sphaerochaetaceae bacterium]|nr:EFR1 family ferrodoxin [Sphaerochaetaceae bacterium]